MLPQRPHQTTECGLKVAASENERGGAGGGGGVSGDRYQEAANWTDSKAFGPHKLNQCLKPTEEPHACQAPRVASERCRLFPTNCSHQSVINGYWKEPFTGTEYDLSSAPVRKDGEN